MGGNQGTVQGANQGTVQGENQGTLQGENQGTLQGTIETTLQEALPITSTEPNITQLNRQLHELEQVFQSKQNMIEEEVSKSTLEITQWLKTYQNSLLDAHQAMIAGVEKAKYNAKEYLNKISSELQIIKVDIETLARETIFQPERIEALSNQLNQNQEKLETYEMTKDTELQIVLPKYTIKFQCNPISTTETTETNQSSETESLSVGGNIGRRSSRRHSRWHSRHPYGKASASVQKKNTSSRNDETDRN